MTNVTDSLSNGRENTLVVVVVGELWESMVKGGKGRKKGGGGDGG